jgi:hypothetical protein
MPETPAGSEENHESGISDDGASTVDEPTGGTPPASDAAEIARRKWQSDLDRERAARERAEAEIARLKGQTVAEPEKGLSAADVASIVRETVRREGQVRDIVVRAAKDYPNADPALLADPSSFETPEAFDLALKQSHQARSQWEASERERIAADVRAEYGIKLAGAAAGGGEPPKGTDQLTAAMVAEAGIDDLRRMSDEDLRKLAHSFTQE